MQHDSGEYKHDVELRARLQAFSPDEPGVVFPFSARLARETGWTVGYTARVMEEYRRFVYLAMTAGHPVSPSPRVDEVWHLHLTYTRSYWDEMCGRVLGRPLHHEPTTGGRDESAKFVDWYARTRESYRRAFGEDPPRDIWPLPAAPAAPAPKPSATAAREMDEPRPRRAMPIAIAAALVLVFAAACSGVEPSPGLIVGGFVAVLTVALIAIIASNSSATTAGPRAQARRAARQRRAVRTNQARDGSGGGSSCSGGMVWVPGAASAADDGSRQNGIDFDRGSDTTFSSSSNDGCDAGGGDGGGGDGGGSSCGSSCGGGE